MTLAEGAKCACPSNPEGTKLHDRFCSEALSHNTMAGTVWVTKHAYDLLFADHAALERALGEAKTFAQTLAEQKGGPYVCEQPGFDKGYEQAARSAGTYLLSILARRTEDGGA